MFLFDGAVMDSTECSRVLVHRASCLLFAASACRLPQGIPDNDIGAVDDESPVPGIYNPQMEGEAESRCHGLWEDKLIDKPLISGFAEAFPKDLAGSFLPILWHLAGKVEIRHFL